MAVTLRGTYETHSDSATSLSLNLASLTGGSGASVVNGDLVIVHATHDTGASALSGTGAGSGGGAAYEPPLQDISDNASASVRAAVWARVWVTGDSTTPTFQTAGLANGMILRCSVYDLGGATINSFQSSALGLNTAAATITATGLTFAGSSEFQWLGVSADDLVTVATAPTGLASPNDMTLIGYVGTAAMAAASYYHFTPAAGSLTPTLVWSGNTERIALHVRVLLNTTSAALTGTATSSTIEQDIRTGGKTIILTLTGDTWVASGATFDAQRQAIINGIDSAQAEAAGWDAVVKAGLAVTTVVRTSNTVVTITLSAFASYQITATETITATVPGSALTGGSPLVAAPTFTVTRGADDLVQPVGTTTGAGVPATSGGSLTSDAAGLSRITMTVDGVTSDTVHIITKR